MSKDIQDRSQGKQLNSNIGCFEITVVTFVSTAEIEVKQ